MLSLLRLRKRIDRLDDHIVILLNQRIRLAERIGNLKALNGEKVYNGQREREVLARLDKNQKGPLNQLELHLIYKLILRISREHQKQLFRRIKNSGTGKK